ncbi:hypothetical protein CAPTEDRAFT_208841 [Capitella teleta]|uniref:Uncharacterized protein n=1 Tax=Capitella teleta TaxID=283909 RepID=R7UGN1_CAPTE|nr:hypothetical protein CAPTEDRAFT_208841 [Capitella teleta]|eukprot:ELU02417.1 hypothetical protein CAPTEDRAFT_208841 [Capitella teleta]
MDRAVDARLPQRYKEWRREVRNELRLSIAKDSDKTEMWACTNVVVCSWEQGEDILQQAGMLAAIEPSTPTPVVVPADIPDVWVTDRIDLHDLARRQKEQFCDAYVEASQETDESPYIVQGSLLFTMAEPSRNAGRYLRLLLPQQFRQQVIDRCHAEEEGERLQAIRLAERILREYRSKQKETYRENEPGRVTEID